MADVNMRGPIFDGRAKVAARAFAEEAEESVAQEGYNDVRMTLGRVLRHPTGYYESRIQTENRGSSHSVNDSGVIYGHWLEGTGSRNKTTRFKGYATFRKVTQTLSGKAVRIAQSVLPKYLGRMQ